MAPLEIVSSLGTVILCASEAQNEREDVRQEQHAKGKDRAFAICKGRSDGKDNGVGKKHQADNVGNDREEVVVRLAKEDLSGRVDINLSAEDVEAEKAYE